MNNRIKELRTSLNLTMDAFGSRIGITRSAVSNIEKGYSNPSDQVILSICREYHVSEGWLRTGEGTMYPPRTRAQEIAEFASTLLNDSPDSARSVIISNLMRLDVEDWEAIARILKKLSPPQ